ncbi:MAG TPA: hypothetical protein VEK57_30485 [Thermoanaerobaculia bacterium]|nr:hypothetical protein [Thermoanaerobaculia bacterium]
MLPILILLAATAAAPEAPSIRSSSALPRPPNDYRYRLTGRLAEWVWGRKQPFRRRDASADPVHLTVCAVRVFEAAQHAFTPRSYSHHAGRRSAADRRPICEASSPLFPWNTRSKAVKNHMHSERFPRRFFASENRDLASQLARYNFLTQPSENTKAAEVAADECLVWRADGGSNPRPPA